MRCLDLKVFPRPSLLSLTKVVTHLFSFTYVFWEGMISVFIRMAFLSHMMAWLSVLPSLGAVFLRRELLLQFSGLFCPVCSEDHASVIRFYRLAAALCVHGNILPLSGQVTFLWFVSFKELLVQLYDTFFSVLTRQNAVFFCVWFASSLLDCWSFCCCFGFSVL